MAMLFHPESKAAKLANERPKLFEGHRGIPCVPAPVTFYVLYESPKDFMGKFVLRRWVDQTPDPKPMAVSSDLIDVLAKLPKNVRCLGRHQGEDPVIKDVWTPVI